MLHSDLPDSPRTRLPAEVRPGTLLVRAEATEAIGTGHVMRCVALGQEWSTRGGDVLFVARSLPPHLEWRVRSERFELHGLQSDELDADEMLELIARLERRGKAPHWIAIDGYQFGPRYLQTIQTSGCRVLVIDDGGDLPTVFADLILNQNPGAADIEYRPGPETKVLLGPRYALLRGEFLARRRSQTSGDLSSRILVSMGGADPNDVTSRVLQGLQMIQRRDLAIIVVVGPANRNLPSIRRLLLIGEQPTRLVQSPSNMAAVMTEADLAITAAGSTCLELAFLGLPAVTVVIADNQTHGAEAWARAGFSVNLGDAASLAESTVAEAVERLLQDPLARRRMSECGRRLVDGRGAARVVDSMLANRLQPGSLQ